MAMPWKSIAAEDERLRNAHEKSGEALAKLRYENTIAVGVSFTEYAKHCGVVSESVRTFAIAHQRRLDSDDSSESFDQAIVRARSSAERAAVLEAVAEERGISPRSAMGGQNTKTVQRVQAVARAAAERKGTSVEDEAPRAARVVVGMQRAEQQRRATKKEQRPLYFIIIDGHLEKARRALVAALNESHDIEWDEQYKELIVDALDKVKAIIGLLDMRFADMANVDWDTELAKLGEA